MEPRDLLVISDLHLGEDIGRGTRRTEQLERELVSFLDHHRQDGTPWRLVINGDMLELAGIVLHPDPAAGPLDGHPHDRTYGLGARESTAVLKMRAIVAHHRAAFDALGRFVRAGHALSMVIGNHDAELHWGAVQQTLVRALDPKGTLPEGAIRFHAWFLHVPGVAWIEHGHQYDPYCSFEHVLDPAIDGREIDPNLGFLIMRYLCSQFDRDLHGVKSRSFFYLVQVGLAQGWSRLPTIARGYLDMCARLVQHWAVRSGSRGVAHANRTEVPLHRLADVESLHVDQLRGLCELWERPVVAHLGRLLRALMLDRMLLLLSAPCFLLLPLLVPSTWLLPMLSLMLPALVAGTLMACGRREPVHPGRTMRGRAWDIRQLMGVRFVVMGHSHHACHDGDATEGYLNSGAWAPHAEPGEAFTHVRVRCRGASPQASLWQWRDGGAVRFAEPAACGPHPEGVESLGAPALAPIRVHTGSPRTLTASSPGRFRS